MAAMTQTVIFLFLGALLLLCIALISRRFLLLLIASALFAFGLIAILPPIAGMPDPGALLGLLWILVGAIPTLIVFVISLAIMGKDGWRPVALVSATLCFIPLAVTAYDLISVGQEEWAKRAPWIPYCEALKSNGKYLLHYVQRRELEHPEEFQQKAYDLIVKPDFIPFCIATPGCNVDEKVFQTMSERPVKYKLIGPAVKYNVIGTASHTPKVLDFQSYTCYFSIPYE
jgi:MFS family permease